MLKRIHECFFVSVVRQIWSILCALCQERRDRGREVCMNKSERKEKSHYFFLDVGKSIKHHKSCYNIFGMMMKMKKMSEREKFALNHEHNGGKKR
jgi:hypothetical protein